MTNGNKPGIQLVAEDDVQQQELEEVPEQAAEAIADEILVAETDALAESMETPSVVAAASTETSSVVADDKTVDEARTEAHDLDQVKQSLACPRQQEQSEIPEVSSRDASSSETAVVTATDPPSDKSETSLKVVSQKPTEATFDVSSRTADTPATGSPEKAVDLLATGQDKVTPMQQLKSSDKPLEPSATTASQQPAKVTEITDGAQSNVVPDLTKAPLVALSGAPPSVSESPVTLSETSDGTPSTSVPETFETTKDTSEPPSNLPKISDVQPNTAETSTDSSSQLIEI